MAIGVIIFIAWLVFMALTVFAFIFWAWKENQFHDIEESKFTMLEEHEPEAWPGRELASKRKGRANSRSHDDYGGDS